MLQHSKHLFGADSISRQPSLFDTVRPPNVRAPIAAAADPISSHIAAAEITSSGRRASQKAEILTWLRERNQAFTSAEIAGAAGMDRHMVARRLPDLWRDSLIERGEMRVCTASGRQAITWRAGGAHEPAE